MFGYDDGALDLDELQLIKSEDVFNRIPSKLTFVPNVSLIIFANKVQEGFLV